MQAMTTPLALRVDNFLSCTDAGRSCRLALCCTPLLMALRKSGLELVVTSQVMSASHALNGQRRPWLHFCSAPILSCADAAALAVLHGLMDTLIRPVSQAL